MCTSVQPLRPTTITRHPLQVQERFLQSSPIPIPVYQHPVEMYHETGQKRKNQGADFKNLILLTRNAMKAHRGQSKVPQQKNYVLETRNRNAKSESEVLQWLDKSCPSKPNEAAVDTLATELRNVERRCDRKTSGSAKEKDNSKNVERPKTEAGTSVQGSYPKSASERDKNEGRSKKRLYRDVLANSAENQAMMENVFEKRYDELEQQAIEQYRTSEESLALKYQELERQAMEQYGCCGNATEEGSTSQTSADQEEISDTSAKTIKDTNCSDGRKCSGFGRCSPVNSNEKDTFPRDKFAQTENKSETDAIDNRPSVLSTTASQKVYHESKNTSKGASGDKIDENVRGSSKRPLILVSPYEKRSEARLTRTTDLEEFYCIAQTNKNIFDYYNDTKIGKLGGGDENITIIQSPRTEVWLSGFWTT
ncbi:uncharacterized protein LOC128893308 [Hylaeus anthracinus]|uniref:uncharacterized protein LOC128893303 n=1 Tax=Hylaeus anthracinus TaxID=313031 RepID=UPI0023B9FCBF|nr:uncharacterized protein LOC128893303 [Hylaeus anthracinus]XP_054010146.1 uncharacterized protein LOC128893308 [Hylaeus anthracinus]